MIEQRLEEIDQEERSRLFLGKSRLDRNPERISLLSEADTLLNDYGEYSLLPVMLEVCVSLTRQDQFTKRTSRILELDPPCTRDIESLQNWVDGTGCLAREETAYLSQCQDLACLAPTRDSAIFQLQTWVEDRLIALWPEYYKVRIKA